MFKFIQTCIFLAGLTTASYAQNMPKPSNTYKVNLNNVKNDKLTVEFYPTTQTAKTASFALPRMVPGTYAVYDFSRFATNVQAFNSKGKTLKVTRSKDGQSWEIKKAHKLHKISYEIEDTWDTDKSNVIFEPAGTNFDPANNVFVLNTHGVFGYLKGREKEKISLEINHPANLYGSTSLDKMPINAQNDNFKADNYYDLIDAPIMYAAPDTVSFKVGYSNIVIHTYSPTGAIKSADLLNDIQPIIQKQAQYLGDILPVDRYVFILFLNKEGESFLSGAAGALEHGRSSFYALFEGKPSAIAGMVRDVAAHEFFHIITPLFIHSEEIGNFDFANPKMSKHLWLYEGYTEFCAQHMQTKQGLRTKEEFLAAMGDKLRSSKSFNDDISFTDLSLGALDKYKSQYGNVYQKGALLSMAFELYLLQNADGKYNMQELMKGLGEQYGKDVSFKDDELFDKINFLCRESGYFKTDFSAKTWLETYIGGNKKIDYATALAPFGIVYEKEAKVKEISKFGIADLQNGLDFDYKKMLLKIKSNVALDEFGSKDLGLQEGDLLTSWNGKELNAKTVNTVLGAHDGAARKGDKLTIGILRKDANGEYIIKELSATIREVETLKPHVFNLMPNPTAEQLKLQKAFLGE